LKNKTLTGLTESSPTLHYMPLHLASEHIGSVGPLCPHVEARLVDIDGNDVPEGQPGELWVRGPNIMKGYWKNPEATRNTFQDEWFKTGDIAQRDKDGFY
jgi:long-chain acyl-CoA synthetase